VDVVVTGGAGFIGSHLVEALLADGAAVHVIDDFSTGRLENLEGALRQGAHLHTADVRDEAAMAQLLAALEPELVCHLAAQIDVRRSMAEPAADTRTNVAGTVAMLEAALRCGAKRFLLASTAAVYGNPPAIPTPESQPVAPISAYGASKAAAELYLAFYARRNGLSTLALRMANVYGPRQDPHGEAGVVTIFQRVVAAGEPVTVFGDGRQTRDYVHVRDAVAAFLAAARSRCTGALNIGTGRETSVLAVAEALGATVLRAPGRPGEIERSCLDPRAAWRALGWRAATRVRDGLQDGADLRPRRAPRPPRRRGTASPQPAQSPPGGANAATRSRARPPQAH
jgi:UDP-glucose 4-epimerase